MKRKVISSLLAVSLLSANAGAAFTDIKDNYTQQAASALAGMGIVSGIGDGTFEPDRLLSRAEFTRLAVSALGITNVENFRSYTIFPDVPAEHWASGWVNAAVRHPDFAEKPIIHGLGDGTFQPSSPTTLGEACTVALRMLGYEEKDIGPYWPNDYVSKARALGLLSNLPIQDPGSAMTRGYAAILFRNTLVSENKEGKSMLTALSGAEPVQHAILVSTSETDSSLTKSQAAFYEGDVDAEGNKKLKIYPVHGTLDTDLVGTEGIIIFDKELTDHVSGFLPDHRTSREVKVQRIEPEGLLADDGTGFIYIPRDTPLVVRGTVYKYDEGWFEIAEGDNVTMHFDENGVIKLISASSSYLNYPIVIMGINGTDKSIPGYWKIMKDGKRIQLRDIQEYDVVTLDSANQTALVCSNRITGLLMEAVPSFRYPEQIKVLGTKFNVPEDFSTSFKGFQPRDMVTILFDTYGRVCGVVSDPRAASSMEGVVVASSDSSVTVQLFNNITISGKPVNLVENEEGEKKLQDGLARNAVGQMVRVTQNDDTEGTLNVTRVKNAITEDIRNWDIENRRLGPFVVSPNVQVFEQVDKSVPLSQIETYDIQKDIIPSEEIISFKQDATGIVTSIVLSDVTGESWVYGRVEDTSIRIPPQTLVDEETGEVYETEESYDYRVTMTMLIDGKSETKEFLMNSTLGKKLRRNQIVALPSSSLNNALRMTLSLKVPEQIDTVRLEAFDGNTMVKTRQGYYPIADDVPVYSKKREVCMTLQQAKANYAQFTLYVDKPISEGGKVRIITVP